MRTDRVPTFDLGLRNVGVYRDRILKVREEALKSKRRRLTLTRRPTPVIIRHQPAGTHFYVRSS